MKLRCLMFALPGVLLCLSSRAQSFIDVQPNTSSARPTGNGVLTQNAVLNAILANYGVTRYAPAYPGFKNQQLANTYYMEGTGNMDSLKWALSNSGLFGSVVRNEPAMTLCTSPVSYNDPFYLAQFSEYASKYQLELIQAPCAWSITEGDPKVVVAIADTEFDTGHEDLSGKFVGVFIEDPSAPILEHHGTAVSGSVAAHVNNNKGAGGVGNKVSLAGYRVASGGVSLRNCIVKAYNDGRRVINVSWTGTGGLSTAAVEEMTENGTVLVCAAGNMATAVCHSEIAHIPGVIVVSSVNNENKIGPTGHARNSYVDVCAPGVNVITTSANPFYDYTKGNGTSNASPIVAGTVALMLSVNPCLSAAEVETLLKGSCDPIADAATYPGLHGSGRINAYEAVLAARDFNTATNITSNTSWNTNRVQAGDVIVKSGRTLTISAEVKMICGRFVVEKNARLIVDGGHITSSNPNTKWSGIDLWGDKSLPSAPANQGYLELKNNAIIENCGTAISNFVWDNGAQGGGIIKASNTTFLNCRRAVELNDYPNYSYWVGPGISNCSFDNVTFRIDDMRALSENPSSAPYFFTSWNVKEGIKITNCDFIVATSTTDMPYANRGLAIHLSSSGGLVRDNTFSGLRYGINTTSYTGSPTRYVKVFRNQFDYTSESIMLAGDAFGDIRDNEIRNMLPFYTNRPACGIYIDQARGAYVGCGNSVDGNTDSGPGYTQSKYGSVAFQTGAFSNTIIDNVFSNLHSGTVTQLDNPNLSITCNSYSSGQYGLRVDLGGWDGSGNRLKDQGTGCGSSQLRGGNKFAGLYRSIHTGSTMVPWHYYAANIPDQVPTTSGTAVLPTHCTALPPGTDPNSQCNKPLNCVYSVYDMYDGVILGDLSTRYATLKNGGLRYSTEGRIVYGHIIRAYDDLQNITGLQTFLEGENDDESRRLLIPLYIERGLYNNITSTINSLGISQSEKVVYQNYYNMLTTLQQQARRIDQLTVNEKAMVEGIAASAGELNPQAKALLETAYGYVWDHPILNDGGRPAIEEEPHPISVAISSLSGALPNPAQSNVSVRAWIAEADMSHHPVLVIRNSMGREVFRQWLKAGENIMHIDISGYTQGLYLYSLEHISGPAITKKLSVIK